MATYNPPTALLAAALLASPALALSAEPADPREDLIQPVDAPSPLITDRPDFTESTSAVAPGRVQIESGLTFTSRETDDALEAPEALFRIGLADRLELRLEAPSYTWADAGDDGLGDSSLGFKLELAEQRGARPALAVIGLVGLPTGDSDLTTDHLQPGAILAASWDLPHELALGLNAGATSADDGAGDNFSEYSASVALGFPLAGDLSGFIEYYGLYRSGGGGGPEHVVDGGLTYLVSPDVQLDVFVGAGLSDHAPDWLVGAGVSFRF